MQWAFNMPKTLDRHAEYLGFRNVRPDQVDYGGSQLRLMSVIS